MIWWTKSWNPIIGCTKCSPACDNCYAERLHTQRHKAKTQQATSGLPQCYAKPFDKVQFMAERLSQPLHWRKPQRIFVDNMGDLFHESVTDEQLDSIFAAMSLCPQHTFMLLTKRPERMLEYMLAPWRQDSLYTASGKSDAFCLDWPLPNVWLGTTIWDQASADRAVPILLETPAAKRFVSVEPMLGPVDLRDGLGLMCSPGDLDWVICGGETGPGARPIHPDWARSLRDQCQAAQVPFFFKQWGEWLPGQNEPCTLLGHEGQLVGHDQDGTWGSSCGLQLTKKNYVLMENDGRCYFGSALDYPETCGRDDMAWASRVGTRKAGRVLDGQEWSEVPNA